MHVGYIREGWFDKASINKLSSYYLYEANFTIIMTSAHAFVFNSIQFNLFSIKTTNTFKNTQGGGDVTRE